MGAWWVIIAHGVVSSGIFTIANLLYERSHSRRMLVNKGYSRNGPSFTIFWFIIIIINFAGPFTLNLLGEIYLIIRVVSISNLIIIPVALLSFFSAAYSLLLFTPTQHGIPQFCIPVPILYIVIPTYLYHRWTSTTSWWRWWRTGTRTGSTPSRGSSRRTSSTSGQGILNIYNIYPEPGLDWIGFNWVSWSGYRGRGLQAQIEKKKTSWLE